MIKSVLNILQTNPHYGVSQRVEIAYGKYEYITSWKRAWEKIKRSLRYGKKD
jgi:hypothetical protein